MRLRFLAVLACAAALATGSPSAAQPPVLVIPPIAYAPQAYASAELGFAATFKGKINTGRHPCEGCANLLETRTVWSVTSQAHFGVGVFVFRDGVLQNQAVDEILSKTADSQVRTDKGLEVGRRLTTLAGLPALQVEYTVVLSDRTWLQRAVVTTRGSRVYVMRTMEDTGSDLSEFERMKASFRLL